jgi:hypothetical protein
MRRLLIAAAVASAALAAMPAVEAKSIWLKCGSHEINLDSTRERFSMQQDGKVIQGAALFSPFQINFENHWQAYPNGGGFKHSYAINRKTLEYSKVSLYSMFGNDWEPLSVSPEEGKCLVMKRSPTAGNQI